MKGLIVAASERKFKVGDIVFNLMDKTPCPAKVTRLPLGDDPEHGIVIDRYIVETLCDTFCWNQICVATWAEWKDFWVSRLRKHMECRTEEIANMKEPEFKTCCHTSKGKEPC